MDRWKEGRILRLPFWQFFLLDERRRRGLAGVHTVSPNGWGIGWNQGRGQQHQWLIECHWWEFHTCSPSLSYVNRRRWKGVVPFLFAGGILPWRERMLVPDSSGNSLIICMLEVHDHSSLPSRSNWRMRKSEKKQLFSCLSSPAKNWWRMRILYLLE